MAHIEHHIINRLAVHNLSALLVNDLALIVHHIIILNDLFARFIIARFNLFLRCLNRFGQPFRTDRLAIFEV